jgi:hypothetical protein
MALYKNILERLERKKSSGHPPPLPQPENKILAVAALLG